MHLKKSKKERKGKERKSEVNSTIFKCGILIKLQSDEVIECQSNRVIE